MDAGMPIPALVFSMPMPALAVYRLGQSNSSIFCLQVGSVFHYSAALKKILAH
jgi:hypothetical protein